jgi:hypothetical protein
MSDEQTLHERPPSTSAAAYHEVQAQVDQHFGGKWEEFLKAVQNPAEILHFVMWQHCGGDKAKFESWATDKALPPDWVPRFYGLLTSDGQLPPPSDAPDPAPEAEQN